MKRTWQCAGLAITLASGLSSGAQAAVATLDDWGALTTISSAQCATDVCGAASDLLGFVGSLTVAPVDGGVGVSSASTSTGAYPTQGSARAEATVSAGLAVPVLRAAAAGSANAWFGAQALVAQGYTYTGTGPQTLSLDWTLDGDIVNPDGDAITGFVVFVGFFGVNELSFPDVSQPLQAYRLLSSLALASPEDNFREFTADGAVLAGDTLSIDVDTGAQFYLVMGLMAGAGGAGASAESLSTLSAAFQGAPALSPTISAVPLPAAGWLLLAGLAPLAARSRRHRSAGAA